MRHHANDLPTNELPLRPGQSVLARVYATMPFQVSGRTNALKSFARLNKIEALISCVWRMPCRHCILGKEKKSGCDAWAVVVRR